MTYVPDGKSIIFFAYVDRRQYAQPDGPEYVREMQMPIEGLRVRNA